MPDTKGVDPPFCLFYSFSPTWGVLGLRFRWWYYILSGLLAIPLLQLLYLMGSSWMEEKLWLRQRHTVPMETEAVLSPQITVGIWDDSCMPCLLLDCKSLEGRDGICLAFVCPSLKHSAWHIADKFINYFLIHQTFVGPSKLRTSLFSVGFPDLLYFSFLLAELIAPFIWVLTSYETFGKDTIHLS